MNKNEFNKIKEKGGWVMKVIRNFISEYKQIKHIFIIILLVSIILILLSSSDQMIKNELFKKISYDIGISLMGSVITILCIDSFIKQLETEKDKEERQKEEYKAWVENFNSDIQLTSNHINYIKDMIDMVIRSIELKNKSLKDTDESQTTDIVLNQIKLLANNPPRRNTFNKIDRILVANTTDEKNKELTVINIINNLNGVMKEIAVNIDQIKSNKIQLIIIRQKLLKAQLDFLMLKPRPYKKYNQV